MCLGWGAGLPLPLTWMGSAKVAEFPTEQEAVRFEKYLKSGSGRAFAKRHFAPAKSAVSS